MFTTSDLKKLLQIWADTMSANSDYLIKLDGVVGDSDLGLTMSDGFKAAAAAVQTSEETDLGKTAYTAGKAMSNAVPSTMGTLMASGLMAIGKAFKGAESIDDTNFPDFFQAYFDGVRSRGKAEIGDKTFLDGLAPAIAALRASVSEGKPPRISAANAASAAHEGFLSTQGMLAKHGRAGGRGEQSRDILDPGAAVADLLLQGFKAFIDMKETDH